MKLEELQTLLQGMTTEEKLARIRSIREDRRVSKYAVTHKEKKTQDRVGKITKNINKLSEEDKAALVKLLEAGDAD